MHRVHEMVRASALTDLAQKRWRYSLLRETQKLRTIHILPNLTIGKAHIDWMDELQCANEQYRSSKKRQQATQSIAMRRVSVIDGLYDRRQRALSKSCHLVPGVPAYGDSHFSLGTFFLAHRGSAGQREPQGARTVSATATSQGDKLPPRARLVNPPSRPWTGIRSLMYKDVWHHGPMSNFDVDRPMWDGS